MVIKYIGNHDVLAQGKILFEILGQLKNCGVGRMVTKHEWHRKFPEQPSFVLIRSVEPEMDRWLWRGKMWGDWVFRGKSLGLYEFSKNLDRADWKLIHKHDEAQFKICENVYQGRQIPSKLPLPPLLQFLNKRQNKPSVMIENKGFVDEEHRMLIPLTEKVDSLSPKPDGTIYDVDPNIYLDIYGQELPVRVEKWATDIVEPFGKWVKEN